MFEGSDLEKLRLVTWTKMKFYYTFVGDNVA
jgi:hypothetical protein